MVIESLRRALQWITDYLLVQRCVLYDLLFHYHWALDDTSGSQWQVEPDQQNIKHEHRSEFSSTAQRFFPRAKKKALLIGINYQLLPECGDFGTLDGPHEDVEKMAEYLKEYGFKDIVIMRDTPDAGELAPTRANLEKEIRKFVGDALPGDSLVFHYSGHSDQIKALHDKNEDDGMDEVIIPMDHRGLAPEHRHLLLIDDDLRRLLVDPLPLHSKLTAMFDSCHSGTLLDLDHDKCNDVFPADKLFQVVRTATRVSSVFRRRIYTKTRIHPNVVQSRRLSLEIRPSLDGYRNRQCTIESRVSAFEETSSTSPERDLALQTLSTRNKGSTMRSVTLQLPPLNTQTKPTTIRRRCTGACFMSPTIRQNVISISACKDGQSIIEDDKGCSLSRALINVLRQNKQLTYYELLHQLRCQVNQTCVQMHNYYHQFGFTCHGSPIASPTITAVPRPRKCMASEKSFYTWQPQLASQKRLNLQDRFSLDL